MKFKTMKEKGYRFNLQIFADGGDGGDGADSGDGDDQDGEDDDPDEGGEEEKKYSERDMEEAVKKRLARERRKWQRKQEESKKDGTDKGEEGESEDSKARREAESKASSLEVKVACYEAGVSKDSVDDVAALAKSYMTKDEDMDLEDAIEAVVKKYPQFKSGAADHYEEDEDEEKQKPWGRRQKGTGSKKVNGVEAAFLKKNPGLKID